MNNLLLSGDTHIFAPCSGSSCGEAVVHPEVGKYLIAIGEWVFGLNPFGYRVASALFGSLAILLMCRIARRLTRSTLLGCIAGMLLSLDGMEFVLSRTGILDIFLMFFVLAAFGAMLVDRDVSRARLAGAMALVLHAMHRPAHVQALVWIFAVSQIFLSGNLTLSAVLHAAGNVAGTSVLSVVTKVLWAGGIGAAIVLRSGACSSCASRRWSG